MPFWSLTTRTLGTGGSEQLVWAGRPRVVESWYQRYRTAVSVKLGVSERYACIEVVPAEREKAARAFRGGSSVPAVCLR